MFSARFAHAFVHAMVDSSSSFGMKCKWGANLLQETVTTVQVLLFFIIELIIFCSNYIREYTQPLTL